MGDSNHLTLGMRADVEQRYAKILRNTLLQSKLRQR